MRKRLAASESDSPETPNTAKRARQHLRPLSARPARLFPGLISQPPTSPPVENLDITAAQGTETFVRDVGQDYDRLQDKVKKALTERDENIISLESQLHDCYDHLGSVREENSRIKEDLRSAVDHSIKLEQDLAMEKQDIKSVLTAHPQYLATVRDAGQTSEKLLRGVEDCREFSTGQISEINVLRHSLREISINEMRRQLEAMEGASYQHLQNIKQLVNVANEMVGKLRVLENNFVEEVVTVAPDRV